MARVKSPEAKQRIVSLVPSVTSILLEIGAGRELVGVTKWCKEVAEVGKRPQVADCWKLEIEEVMRLRPTLLIGSVPFATETVETILKQPVAFLAMNPRSLADIRGDIKLLGDVVGREAEAKKLIRKMEQAFAGVRRLGKRLSRGREPVVYSEAWPNPRISSPPWVAELVEMAGGTNAVATGARVTDEEVAQSKPDVIVLAWTATGDRAKREQALQNPLWKDVPAVEHGRVFVIRDQLLNTPGPPLMEGASELLRAMYLEASGAAARMPR